MGSGKSQGQQTETRCQLRVARSIFDDPDALADHDRVEDGEHRWQTLGLAGGVLLLLVAHTVRFENEENDEIIRIISARRADRKERQRYEKERQENRAR